MAWSLEPSFRTQWICMLRPSKVAFVGGRGNRIPVRTEYSFFCAARHGRFWSVAIGWASDTMASRPHTSAIWTRRRCGVSERHAVLGARSSLQRDTRVEILLVLLVEA